ncbi:MAG TPA: carboxypeptidase-like regulatory domain-containing protein [Rhodothermales bacterium]|nr:carboxypeptidase-like regulatory domain-containing protein [Rhodothermales bacterium]
MGLLFAPLCFAQQNVPVRQVVLFTSGVGYFEHTGSVSGNGTTELRFQTEQINDVLKSLLVQDLGGGRVGTVVYPSQAPLDRALRSFEVDLTGSPSLGNLLNQLRGAEVRLRVQNRTIQGTLLSVESQTRTVGGESAATWVISVLAEGSIQSVPLHQIERIELLDPALQEELNKALAALAQARDRDKKPVTIAFRGQGRRDVRIGYVVETPVWKTSYRLVLPAAGERQGYLQGWAIVENQTEMDWDGVDLSLVSGRPISFVQNLYDPLFVERPVVQSQVQANVRPQVYEGGVELPEAEVLMGQGTGGLSGTVRDASTGQPLPGATVIIEGTSTGASTDANGRYQIPNVPSGRYAVQARFVGYQPTTQSVQLGGRPVTINFTLSPAADLDEIVVASEAARRDNFTTVFGAPAPLDPSASVSSQATAAEVGDLFQYTVSDVSLPRQRSAMIPIVSNEIEVERVSIFNPTVMATRPLRGARIMNTTGLHLAPGPITVLDDGTYGGDARLNDLPPDQERLVSFAVDLDVTVDVQGANETGMIQSAIISDGVLHIARKQTRRVVYTLENEGSRDRMIIVEHDRRSGWKLIDTPEPMDSTPEVHRFRVSVGAGETVPFTVQEEDLASETIALVNTDLNRLTYYANLGGLPDEVKRALERAIRLQNAIAATRRQINDLTRELNAITSEQDRIRENMQTVDASTDYYRRLLAKLEEQETRIEQLQRDQANLEQKRQEQEEELRRYLSSLDVR